jgi:chromosome segregation ATPase
MKMTTIFAVILLAGVTPSMAGCNSGEAEAQRAELEAAIAKKKADASKLDEQLAARKAAREAAKKKEDEAKAAYAAKVDALCVLPEKLPKKMTKACDQVAEANDKFMKRMYTGDALAKWEKAKQMQLGMTKAQCTKTGKIEVAACQMNAMNTAQEDMKKSLPDIMRRCIEKFGSA